MARQPTWQRLIVLTVLAYEGLGGFSGGGLLAAAPDGHLMDMPVEIMHGFFPDFLIPGLLLIGFGILNLAAFIAVWRRTRIDWLLTGLALGGLTVWFTVEIAVLGQLHWLHAMWGLPVLFGGLMALPLIPRGARSPVKAFIKQHPLLTFYILAFVISWGGILSLVGEPGISLGSPEFGVAMAAWLAGPSVSSILLTGVLSGRTGYRQLLTRMVHWQVGLRWYAVALLSAPLVYLAIALGLSPSHPEFLPSILATPDRTALLVMGLGYGLIGGGFLEELGWTGFAVPRLRLRSGVWMTGLVAGLLWGAYHFSIIFWSTGGPWEPLGVAILLAQLFAWLPAYRVIMVWVYEHTESLFVTMLMHASVTTSMIVLGPLALSGAALLAHLLIFAAAWWLIVAAVLLTNRGHIAQQASRVGALPEHRARAA